MSSATPEDKQRPTSHPNHVEVVARLRAPPQLVAFALLGAMVLAMLKL